MNIDFYSETREIVAMLLGDGLSSEADALRDAMAAGSSGTEILMRLRWCFQQIDRARKTANTVTAHRIREILKELDKALR